MVRLMLDLTNILPHELPALRRVAFERLASAFQEMREASSDLAHIEVAMTKETLDQPGGKHPSTTGNEGKDTARHEAEQARQDAKANNLAQRVVASASGGVPSTIKSGG